MAKAPRPWIVAPHDPIEKIEDNLWAADGIMPAIPGGSFRRRMSILRLAGGELLFHNAVPLDDPSMAELKTLGTPAILFVPNPFHRLDVHAFRERLGLRVLAPGPIMDNVREVVTVDGDTSALPSDPSLSFEALDGTKTGEGVLLVRSGAHGERVSMVVCDVLLNLPHASGFFGLLWKWMGFTGGPRCGPVWLKRAVTDRAKLRAHLERLAATPGLTRIIPSHGAILDKDPAGVLREVASRIQ